MVVVRKFQSPNRTRSTLNIPCAIYSIYSRVYTLLRQYEAEVQLCLCVAVCIIEFIELILVTLKSYKYLLVSPVLQQVLVKLVCCESYLTILCRSRNVSVNIEVVLTTRNVCRVQLEPVVQVLVGNLTILEVELRRSEVQLNPDRSTVQLVDEAYPCIESLGILTLRSVRNASFLHQLLVRSCIHLTCISICCEVPNQYVGLVIPTLTASSVVMRCVPYTTVRVSVANLLGLVCVRVTYCIPLICSIVQCTTICNCRHFRVTKLILKIVFVLESLLGHTVCTQLREDEVLNL